MEIAVLSYHGWEIDPARLVDDVRALRTRGWRDLPLAELLRVTQHTGGTAKYFHVTLDDGSERDRECVAALRGESCAATLMLSLDIMSDAATRACLALAGPDVAVEDHSLRHARVFRTRHVIGFWSPAAPLVSAPERLNLVEGDPICSYAGELTGRAFVPDARAVALCRARAAGNGLPPGGDAWQRDLASAIEGAGLAFRRLGRLCVAGSYETRSTFDARLTAYLSEGRRRLLEASGRPPTAFAHPWWEPSPTADRILRALGYGATFSGRGVWDGRSTMAIPRVFVSNQTPRPLDPRREDGVPWLPRVKALAARAVFS
jgi:hypothetical protein